MRIGDNPGENQSFVVCAPQRNTKLTRLNELMTGGLVLEKTISVGRPNKLYYLTAEGERLYLFWKSFERGEDHQPMDCGAPSEEGDILSTDCNRSINQ